MIKKIFEEYFKFTGHISGASYLRRIIRLFCSTFFLLAILVMFYDFQEKIGAMKNILLCSQGICGLVCIIGYISLNTRRLRDIGWNIMLQMPVLVLILLSGLLWWNDIFSPSRIVTFMFTFPPLALILYVYPSVVSVIIFFFSIFLSNKDADKKK
jgi:uncharacterized membrane protein YhaH (DUF805 family)